MYKAVIALVALTALGGCHIERVVKEKPVKLEPSVIQKKVHEDNLVHIITKDGKVFDLRVTWVTSEAVTGETDVETVTIPFNEIDSMTVEKSVPAVRAGAKNPPKLSAHDWLNVSVAILLFVVLCGVLC